MYVLVVTAVVQLMYVRTSARFDGTLTPERNGSSVVRAVIAKIDASEVFNDSTWWQSTSERPLVKIFLRRMAYVETEDGNRNSVGGIWDITEEIFRMTQTYVARSQSIRQNLMNSPILKIDWHNIVYTDMTVPMYSGLAVALYLDKLILDEGRQILPTNLYQLYRLWNYFGEGASGNTRSWEEGVRDLENNERTY